VTTTQLSIDEQMWYIHTKGILLRPKKEGTCGTLYDIDEPQRPYAK
jgi:hypothetical protein